MKVGNFQEHKHRTWVNAEGVESVSWKLTQGQVTDKSSHVRVEFGRGLDVTEVINKISRRSTTRALLSSKGPIF